MSSSSSRENSGSGLQQSPVTSETELRIKNEKNFLLSNGSASEPIEELEVDVRNSTYIETELRPTKIDCFPDELYQFYSQAVIEKDCRGNDSDSEAGYEKIGDKKPEDKSDAPKKIEISSPKLNSKSLTPAHRHNRSLWCEIPEIKSSGILDVLTTNERKLQEAKFEIVASEVSYLKSLHVLEQHFREGLEKGDCLSQEERDVLFGRIRAVTECSERLMADLEECWSSSILLPGVCDIILRHSKQYFQVNIK